MKDRLRSWLRGRGFVIVLIAALVPPALTAAWVFTHQADIGVTDIQIDGAMVGENVTATATLRNLHDEATGPFNATIRIGFFTETLNGLRFTERTSEDFHIDDLGPGATRTLSLNWTAQGGSFIALVDADTDDALAEIEERNNRRYQQFFIDFPAADQDIDPFDQLTERPDATETADLVATDVTWSPDPIFSGNETTVTASFRNDGPDDASNATLHIQVFRVGVSGLVRVIDHAETMNLTAGQEMTINTTWRPTQVAQFVVAAIILPGPDTNEPDGSDNIRRDETVVDREFLYEEPEPKATAKDFYRDVLSILHLKLLIPLVALFYAAGVIEDEKDNLPYLLTRPVPRWKIPILRFGLSFAVGGIAMLIGVLATFFLLLGLPQDAPGFLYWPMLYSLVALLVYTAIWTLAGVTMSRPYLFGLLFAIGWESVIIAGRNILVNGRPVLQDWVLNLSMNHWVSEAFNGWDPDTVRLVPEGDALRALWVILAIAVASLGGSAWWMTKREF